MVVLCLQNLHKNILMIPTRHTICIKRKNHAVELDIYSARRYKIDKCKKRKEKNIIRFLNCTWTVLLGHLRCKQFLPSIRSVWINEILWIFILHSFLPLFFLCLLCSVWGGLCLSHIQQAFHLLLFCLNFHLFSHIEIQEHYNWTWSLAASFCFALSFFSSFSFACKWKFHP